MEGALTACQHAVLHPRSSLKQRVRSRSFVCTKPATTCELAEADEFPAFNWQMHPFKVQDCCLSSGPSCSGGAAPGLHLVCRYTLNRCSIGTLD